MNKLYVYGKAAIAMLFWALTFVWIKIAFEAGYRPYEIVFLRLLLAAGLLFAVMLVTNKLERLSRKDTIWMMLVAFCEPFAYFIGESNGLQYVSSTLGSLIISLIPIFTAVAAFFLLREKISWLIILGLLVSTLGVVIMSTASGDMHATLKGILFLLLAVFAGMFYGITVRRLTLKYSALTIVAWQSLFGLIYFIPLFLYYDGQHFVTMAHNARGLITIAGMSLFASVGSFMLYTGVIRDLGVIKSNIFTNLIPVFTATLAFFILGDLLTLRAFIGIALTLAGLLLSQGQDLLLLIKRPDRNFN